MRLKKLELFGFKSFADKTTVVFDQGVTCIVGPNGCGKSNISDSIRWVLGERSPKVLRGSKMEDVIFNGTDFRKPIGFAEVSLTLDNSDKTLPIEYDEVTITRRLHRSGESEYLINKTACRLKDIYDLILDTGLGSSTYSMIEQGKIDYILNANPEERRFLIEEAAGISKYEAKKDEAIRKLERTEENRTRLNDILHEVQKNIQYAERQAKRAQKYREHYDRLKDLEIRKAFHDVATLQNESQNLASEETHKKEILETFEKQLSALKEEQSKLNEILHSILDRYAQEDSKRHHLQSQMEKNEQTLRFHQEQGIEMAARKGQIQQEQLQLEDRIQRNTQDKKLKEAEIAAQLAEKDQASSALTQAETVQNEIEQKILECRKFLDQIKSETFQIAMQLTQVRNEYHRTSAFLDTSDEQQKKQDQSSIRLKHELTEWNSKEQALSADLTNTDSKLQQLSENKDQKRAHFDALKRHLEESRNNIQKNEREIHEIETQLKILLDIDRKHEITEKTFLEGDQDNVQHLATTLRDIFSVREGYEWALEAALESFSKSLIVEDLTAAEILLASIKQKKPDSIGLLIKNQTVADISQSDALEHPLIDQPLAQVIAAKEGYEVLCQTFSKDVYITRPVENFEQLKSLMEPASRFKFLVPDGTILGPYARLLYRSSDSRSADSIFQRASEIKHLEALLEERKATLARLQNESQDMTAQLQSLQSEMEQIEVDHFDATIQKESMESHRRGILDRIASLHKEIEINTLETQEFQEQRQETLSQREKLELKLKVEEEEERKIREKQEELMHSLEKYEEEKSQNLKLLTESRIRYQNFEERIQLLQEAIRMLEENRILDENRREDLKKELESLTRKERDLQTQDGQIREAQLCLEQTRRESEVALELIRREKDEAESALAISRDSVDATQQKSQAIHQELHNFDMKKMDLGYQEKNIHERLLQVYKIQLSEFSADTYPVEGDFAEMEAVINTLREKLDNIGTVNLLAIEEYDELKQRFDFLSAQMKDLEDAREQLLETIRQINRTTKSLFEQTFIDVQKYFQEYYETLFRGGMAKLTLTDETNPLESGIDIVVRPPGKKPQHISLLSGGEKALTCIALLFALFKIKPSPFCVLDEVDAPLDEANVDRFLNVLKTFLKLSQFIIVTHNRKTIAMGDSLYGVTMQEAGISKIVSVKVSDDNSSAEPNRAAEEDSQSIEEQLQN